MDKPTAAARRLSLPMRDLLWTIAQHKYGWCHVCQAGRRRTAVALARRGLVAVDWEREVCSATAEGREAFRDLAEVAYGSRDAIWTSPRTLVRTVPEDDLVASNKKGRPRRDGPCRRLEVGGLSESPSLPPIVQPLPNLLKRVPREQVAESVVAVEHVGPLEARHEAGHVVAESLRVLGEHVPDRFRVRLEELDTVRRVREAGPSGIGAIAASVANRSELQTRVLTDRPEQIDHRAIAVARVVHPSSSYLAGNSDQTARRPFRRNHTGSSVVSEERKRLLRLQIHDREQLRPLNLPTPQRVRPLHSLLKRPSLKPHDRGALVRRETLDLVSLHLTTSVLGNSDDRDSYTPPASPSTKIRGNYVAADQSGRLHSSAGDGGSWQVHPLAGRNHAVMSLRHNSWCQEPRKGGWT